MRIKERAVLAWNAWRGNIPRGNFYPTEKISSRPEHRSSNVTASDFTSSIFNRIAMDVANTEIRHVKNDKSNGDQIIIEDGLHYIFNVEANIDQSGIAFRQDIAYSMFDEQAIAVVPIDYWRNESGTISDIETMRVGKIIQWSPEAVKVRVYNDKTGEKEEGWFKKSEVAIIENPLYPILSGPNSSLQRLVHKMSMMDDLDRLISSGRLDIIMQLPYAVKTELQMKNAKERLESIEEQLRTGSNGIAYVDSTEKITQLNRPANSQLQTSIDYLTNQFFNQLGLTENIFNGTATEAQMRVYYSRTIDVLVDNIIKEFDRKFISKTARTQGHTLEAYRDMFKLVPIQEVAKLGDTFRRNQIATSNEMRKIVGFPHHPDPNADLLFNPNMPMQDQPGNESPLGMEEEGELNTEETLFEE